jgi:glycosyltransferase involved in cell wall biosynthesis
MPIAPNPRIIVHTPEPQSGAAKYVAELAIALHQAGMRVVLFCPENFADLEQVREAGVEVALAPARNVSDAGKWSRLTRMMRYLGGSLRAHLKSTRRGDLVHFQHPLRMPFGSLRSIEHAFLRMEYRACDAVIAHNRIGCEVLRGTFGVAENRIFQAPHGPYMQAKSEAAYPEFSDLRLLAFGSIRENKGLHLAIEAVQVLGRERAMPVRLTVAGGIETMAEGEYWQRCKAMIERQPEAFQVIEGYIPDETAAALMGSHHAVILPYAEFYSESGVAMLALVHGRPIVATGSGGLGELMEAANCGVAIARADTRAVAAAIAEAFDLGGERLQGMGTAGKLYLERTRNWERVVELTADVYRAARNHSRGERTTLLTAR